MNSVQLQAFGAGDGGSGSPATLCQALSTPTRVVVRNNNAPGFLTHPMLLSYDETVLSALVGTSPGAGNIYKLPLQSEDVFVLQPGQTLYAIGLGGPVEASWAVSDVIPDAPPDTIMRAKANYVVSEARMNSVLVQAAANGEGGVGNPSTLCQARDAPTRVVVRNNNQPDDPTLLWLSFDETVLSALSGGPGGGNVYKLPVQSEDVFVLQPGQTLYAIAWSGFIGTTSPVETSWAVSDVIPDAHD